MRLTIAGVGEGDDKNAIRAALATPTPDRILKVAQALRLGATVEQIHAACKYDPWFIREIDGIVKMEAKIRETGLPKDAVNFRAHQGHGLFRPPARRARSRRAKTRSRTIATSSGVRPVFKRIDTCAAEFASPTAYMYSTYETGLAGRRRQRGAAFGQARRSSSSAAAPTASARASNSTIAAAMPASRCMMRAMNRSWSIAIRRPCRPTTTPPTGSISSP